MNAVGVYTTGGGRVRSIAPPVGSGAGELNAPNLQFLMDSPVEFGAGALTQFESGGAHFLVAVHHEGSEVDLDGFTRMDLANGRSRLADGTCESARHIEIVCDP